MSVGIGISFSFAEGRRGFGGSSTRGPGANGRCRGVGWLKGWPRRPRPACRLLRDIDTSFASAYQLIAIATLNSGGAQSRQIEAQTRAYWHRDRLPAYERYLVTSAYQRIVESDLEGAIESARLAFEENRTRGAGLLASRLGRAGRCERRRGTRACRIAPHCFRLAPARPEAGSPMPSGTCTSMRR